MTRRWKDPRSRRIWEVEVCSLPAGAGGAEGRVLLFQSTGTPRNGHAVPCCPGVAEVLRSLDDQSLALCLDAALHGGYLWRDQRDGRLWWVRGGDADGPGSVRFVDTWGELVVELPGPLGARSPEALMRLRDRAAPSTAA